MFRHLRLGQRIVLKAFHVKINHFYHEDAKKYIRILESFIDNNDGKYKNPNILHYLAVQSEPQEGPLAQAAEKLVKPTDAAIVICEWWPQAEKFKSQYRITCRVFIIDKMGVTAEYKAKYTYKQEGHKVVETHFKELEKLWERPDQVQREVEEQHKSLKEKNKEWFDANRDAVDTIMMNLPRNQYTEKVIKSLEAGEPIDTDKLKLLYMEAKAQKLPRFTSATEANITITHFDRKEQEFSHGYSTQVVNKRRLFGVSDTFSNKVMITFGGARQDEQLAHALKIPLAKLHADCVRIYNEAGDEFVHDYGMTEVQEEEIELGKQFLKHFDRSAIEVRIGGKTPEFKAGEKVVVSIQGGYDWHGVDKEPTVVVRETSTHIYIKNPLKPAVIKKMQKHEDLEDHRDKVIGQKIHVQGEFSLFNDLVIVKRPKFV